MSQSTGKTDDKSREQMTDEEKRADDANKIYCKACEESGLKVASWENFEAWQKYVEGKIDDVQMVEKAKQEMEQFSKKFGKYIVVEKEDPMPDQKEEEKRERARQANKTYKRVCEEARIDVCFFSNFSTWSDYVKGKMSEEDFYDKAKLEVRKMASEGK